jgi:hypothetical protein
VLALELQIGRKRLSLLQCITAANWGVYHQTSLQLPPRGIGLLCNLRQSRSYTPRTQKLSASKCTHLLVGDHPPITPVARCCQNDVQSDKGGECKCVGTMFSLSSSLEVESIRLLCSHTIVLWVGGL